MLARREYRVRNAREPNSGRQGFVLLTSAIAMIAVVEMLGLAIDVGRMYVVKAELQAWSDSAATAAAYALSGTPQGIANAATAIANVSGSPSASNRWNFGTQLVTTARIGFSASAGGPFVPNPASASGVVFAQVTVSENVPLYFLPVLPSAGPTKTVSATSIAGQLSRNSIGDGISPFSPDAHSLTDPNFGFTIGQQYTLRWPPPGKQGKTGCAGDAGYSPATSSDRGYVDIGQGGGNSGLISAIVDNDYALSSPMTLGSTISMLTGQGSVSNAMQTRFNEDTDTTSTSFSSYTGNGRRVLVVPVNDGSDPAHLVGFAGFFVPPNACGSGNTSACCAEYIGPALEFANHAGGASSGGIYQVQLIR